MVTALTPRGTAEAVVGGGGGDLARGARGELGARLARRLSAVGPIAARFGIYLGTRVDLLSAADCLRLLEIPDRGPASAAGPVRELIERELDARLETLFDLFEPEPFDSGLVFQWHRARLLDGQAVTIQAVHPELEPELERGRLGSLVRRWIANGDLPERVRGAAAAFESGLDLVRAGESLARLAEETEGSIRVEVPEVVSELCTARVRVDFAIGTDPASTSADDRRALELRARWLARSWFAQVLRGDLFSVEPWGREVRYLARGRVAFVGGAVARLPRYLVSDLRDYLAAAVAGEPARAAQAFAALLPGAPADRRLRFRLRHAEPFRDQELDVGGDRLVRQVLAHCRAAEELGYPLGEELAPFYRGLFLLNHETRALGAKVTPIRDGFREARLLVLLEELREEVGRSGVGIFERQLELMSGLPRKLDRILTLAAEPVESRADELDSPAGSGTGRRRSGASAAACLMAIVAVVLLARHLGDAGTFGLWSERVGALLVALFGGLLLWTAGRAHDD